MYALSIITTPCGRYLAQHRHCCLQLEAGHAAHQQPSSIWDKLQTKDAQLGILSMVLLVSHWCWQPVACSDVLQTGAATSAKYCHHVATLSACCSIKCNLMPQFKHAHCLMQIFQGTALSLILRFSRTTAEVPYLASVAVIWTELIKLVICIVAECLVCRRTAREKGVTYLREVQNDLRDIIATSVPMVVPAALFVMQQVRSALLYIISCMLVCSC